MTVPEHHSTPPRPRPADVGRAVAAALVTGGSEAELRALVCDYVRMLKRAGEPPERALARVKEVIGLPSRFVRGSGGPSLPSEQLADSIVEWFVSEYYRVD